MPILIFPAGAALLSSKNRHEDRKDAGAIQKSFGDHHGLLPRCMDTGVKYREEPGRIFICAPETDTWVDAPELGYVDVGKPLKRKLMICGKEKEDLRSQKVIVDNSLGFSVAQITPNFSFGNGVSILPLSLTTGQLVWVAVIVVDPVDLARTQRGWQSLAAVAQ